MPLFINLLFLPFSFILLSFFFLTFPLIKDFDLEKGLLIFNSFFFPFSIKVRFLEVAALGETSFFKLF